MHETDVSHWDRLPNGDIETAPIAGWETACFPLNVMLRFEILMEDGRIGTAQMHLPANQAVGLAEALRHAAALALATGRTQPT